MTSPTEPPDDEGLLLPDGSPANPNAHPVADGGEDDDDERSPYSPFAVISALPLPVRRITRVQAIALVLFTLISLGPVVALVVMLRADTSDLPVVVTENQITAVDGLNLSLTITTVNAVSREMTVRMSIRSSSTEDTGLIEGGRMTETVDIGLPPARNSLEAGSTVTLEEGSTVSSVEFVVPLSNGSISRYPYDTYDAQIFLIASRERTDGGSPTAGTGTDDPTGSAGTNGRIAVPISIVVSAEVPGFVVDGDLPPDQATSSRLVEMEVRRNVPTLLYTSWIMFLWWALSVSAVFILWSVAIWRSSTPPWAYGYLVGVLFALAPLRGALPGQPPPGVLIDYVSFYWAVGTIGLGLLFLVSFFVRDARTDGRSRSRTEEELLDRTGDIAYDAHGADAAVRTGEQTVVVAGQRPDAGENSGGSGSSTAGGALLVTSRPASEVTSTDAPARAGGADAGSAHSPASDPSPPTRSGSESGPAEPGAPAPPRDPSAGTRQSF